MSTDKKTREHNRNLVKRTVLTFISVIVMGFALSLLNLVNLGTDPCTFLNLSLSEKLGISFGNWQVIFNVILFIPVILWGRKQIGIGTLFNMILVGYSVDFFSWLWSICGISAFFDRMAVRLCVMLPALAVFILAAAVYMAMDLGTSPYDALPFMLSRKIKKIPFSYIRLAWDFSAIAIGFAVSKRVAPVTILMALFLGRTVTFVKNALSRKLR